MARHSPFYFARFQTILGLNVPWGVVIGAETCTSSSPFSVTDALHGTQDHRRFRLKLRRKLANVSDGRIFVETLWGSVHVLRDPLEDEAHISA